MSDNPYVKPLKPFDPKKDLIVNEKFSVSGIGSKADTLSSLEIDELETSSNAGKEFSSIKTDGSLISGIIKLENNLNKTILLASNKRGRLYLLTPENNALKIIKKFEVRGSILRTPAYANGIIYCTTREGLVYAIETGLNDDIQDIKSGINPKILWQKKMRKGILTEPIATGKILIVATLGGIYGFEAYFQDESNKSIGRQLWSKSLNGVVSSPNMYSGNIYIGTDNKKLYAFDYGGSKIGQSWVFKSSGAIRVKPCVSQKANAVIAPTIDGYVYCVDRRTGKYKWSFVAKSPIYSNIVAASIGNEEHFFFGADNGLFYCLNSLGKKVWIFRTHGKIRTEALVKGQVIYFGAEDNNLYALNIRTGKQVFRFATDGNINSRPIIANDIIYFGSTDSFVHGVYI